jgi:large subunit ribosomal protein L18e
MPEVNVGRIAKHTQAKDQVAVPGKVLGCGDLDHAVVVAGLGFSERAREKIVTAGGECIGLAELAHRNPKGSNVKLIA